MWGAGKASNALQRARFNALVAQHLATLQVTAARLCRQPAEVPDLIQDTLLRAWTRFESLKDDDRARAWLIQIMRNRWLDLLRARHPEVSIDDVVEIAPPPLDEPSPWERVTIDDIRAAIEQLPDPFRAVAVLHDIEGLSYREVATRLGIPYATAATRRHRAHQRIKQLLLGAEDEDDER